MELLGHASYIQRGSQMRNVLVNIYTPGYQDFQTLVVTCQHKVQVSLRPEHLFPHLQHTAPPNTRPRLLPAALFTMPVAEGAFSPCHFTQSQSPLLAASCVGEGRQDSSWGLAPYSRSSSVQLVLPREHALNKGVTPSMVSAFT